MLYCHIYTNVIAHSLVYHYELYLNYKLKNYEIDFTKGRKYLKENRGLSDETIDYFFKTGNLALVNKKTKDGYEEKVIVFKYLDEEKT